MANSPNIQFNSVATLYGGAANTSITNLGNVIINGGCVTLDATTVDNLQANMILIQHGGTLINGTSNMIDNNTPMNLNNGTWQTADNSEILGTLTLSAGSTIQMGGSGTNANVIQFANSSSLASEWSSDDWNLLDITSWDGNLSGNGTDQLIFGNSNTSLTSAQLNQIVFVDPAGLAPGNYSAIMLTDGEVVPSGTLFRPVPEPATDAAGALLTVLAGVWEIRRRRSAKSA
jgi:hypothetical protein